MAELGLPSFDDKAKKSMTPYKTFGGKVVKVIYGATDGEGNPVEPMAEKDDGHGEWYGIECDGEYTMFAWRKPASEGGETVYGTSHEDHALEDMQADLEKKKALCLEAQNLEGDEGEMTALKEKWDAIEDWHTPRDKELAEWFAGALRLAEEKAQKAGENRKIKEELLTQAKSVLEMKNYKKAGEKLNGIFDTFKETGSAGKQADAEMRKELRAIRRTLNENRRNYFDNIEEMQAAAKQTKEELIEEAKKVSADVKNYKDAGAKMDELFAKWKEAGRSGKKADDDALWEQFNTIRKDFFAGRKVYFQERSNQWKASVSRKKELIEQAKEIAAAGDYSKEATEEMKNLDVEYKAAGYSGKDHNDALWKQFSEAKEVFWQAKHEETLDRLKNVVSRKKELAEELTKEIEDLNFQAEIKPDLDAKYEIEREIDRKTAMKEQLVKQIADLEKKTEA